MKKINVNSEIGRLKVVLLHEPGDELHNLTPKKLDDLLFDDIPWLPLAKKEHQAFADTFRQAGVEVVYLEDLVAEVLDQDPGIRERFLRQVIAEAGVRATKYHEIIFNFLDSIKDISQRFGFTESSVTVTLTRLRKRLAAFLEKEDLL